GGGDQGKGGMGGRRDGGGGGGGSALRRSGSPSSGRGSPARHRMPWSSSCPSPVYATPRRHGGRLPRRPPLVRRRSGPALSRSRFATCASSAPGSPRATSPPAPR